MKPTVNIILDTRRANKDNKYPVKLRITYQRIRKYYGIDIQLSKDDWGRVHGEKPREEFRNLRRDMDKIVKDANDLIKTMEHFSFVQFEKDFFKLGLKTDVLASMEDYAKVLEKDGRIGTAISYRCAKNSLSVFQPTLKYSEITPEFLKRYERWMLTNDKSATTVGFYLRSLRTLVNIALQEGVITPQQYPFGKTRYQIPKGQNIKKALTLTEIRQIIDYEAVPNSNKDKARDFWLLSYYCNGANITDICRWKYSNLKNNKLVFHRAKTEFTSRNPKPIEVVVTQPVKQIINKWGNRKKTSENYIFPILVPGISPKEEKKIIARFIHLINDNMDGIADTLKINKNLTTYVARHTFSTILKRSGAPISYISESLGHMDMHTTENYLDSFENDQKQKFANLLVPKKHVIKSSKNPKHPTKKEL
ncbi:MAG TPA: site-specific integrase [Bacteroidales bacterium]|nr:site-specific integrase [Bacteroidales bacterium]HPI31348.1 site-specific integrase [Bacteroidales bacterium]HQN17325.1 site-specific integrase [Bacteroidales bacterium]